MEIKRVSSKEGKQFEIAIKELKNKVCRVGWFKGAKYGDGTIVAEVAAQNEYGNPTKNIPARPFMRPTIAAKEKDWKKTALGGAKEILKNKLTVTDVLTGIGKEASGDIQRTISRIYEPPLSPRTIQARIDRSANIGRLNKNQAISLSKPLIDTGYMYETLIYEVSDS